MAETRTVASRAALLARLLAAPTDPPPPPAEVPEWLGVYPSDVLPLRLITMCAFGPDKVCESNSIAEVKSAYRKYNSPGDPIYDFAVRHGSTFVWCEKHVAGPLEELGLPPYDQWTWEKT